MAPVRGCNDRDIKFSPKFVVYALRVSLFETVSGKKGIGLYDSSKASHWLGEVHFCISPLKQMRNLKNPALYYISR